MKIAHIVCTYPPYRGGIGKSAEDFASMMAEAGHIVDVYTPVYTSVYTTEESAGDNLTIKRIKPLLSLGNGAFLPSLFFKLKKYDLIYLHYPFFGGAEVVWLFKLFNKKSKLILHYHMDVLGLSLFYKIFSLPSRLIERSLLKKADLITAASLDYIASSNIASYYNKHKNKFRETYFPVDTESFYPEKDKKKKKAKTILFVGGLDKAHYFKGLEVLIKSLAMLKDRKDWELKIVGEGGLKDKYIQMTSKNNIADRVYFLGSVSSDSLGAVYRGADFFVLPSLNKGEAFGIVLLEAMASGLPVLASDLPGVRSVFTQNTGDLLEPGDSIDLSVKIKNYLDDNDIGEKGDAARNLVLSRYSKDKIALRLSEILKTI